MSDILGLFCWLSITETQGNLESYKGSITRKGLPILKKLDIKKREEYHNT
ncbi:hypothetical protein KOI40_05815 [Aestuariicella sp. G3-2]|nr:hypothetical protein [Aestuariicella albida]MBU3069329.1 hypothetical protein [Aestuariicella albida]